MTYLDKGMQAMIKNLSNEEVWKVLGGIIKNNPYYDYQ